MNSLSLRVSAIKTSENTKKNSEIRVSAIALPATKWFTDASATEEYSSEDLAVLNAFKSEYAKADGIEPQLLALKKITNKVTSEDGQQVKLFVQAITDIYFHANLKHPVRNTLAKILHTTPHRKNDIVASLLRTTQESNAHVLTITRNTNSNIHTLNDFINSLTGCFENFPEAIAAMANCFKDLLLTIDQIVSVYLDILKDTQNLSPAKRSEIYIFLHNAIRVALSMVQHYQSHITQSETLAHLLEQTWDYLIQRDEYADVPMDTKVNCGILKVIHDRIFGDVYADAVGGQRNWEEASYAPETIREFCYVVAVLNTIDDTDVTNARFFASINTIVEHFARIARVYTMDSSVMMALARGLVQLSKKMLVIFRKHPDILANATSTGVVDVIRNCLVCMWINVDHTGDSVRHQAKELLKNLLKMSHQYQQQFAFIADDVFGIAKVATTSETLVCLLLDYACQVFGAQRVLSEVPDLQERILANIFKEPNWSACYDRLMISSSNGNVGVDEWCETWIRPLLRINEFQWQSYFDRLKVIRNLFDKSLRARPEAAEYILAHPNLSLEIYLFVLWTMRRSGRKSYAPTCWRPSDDQKVVDAKTHPTDEIRILVFRILIECHKTTELFPASDLDEIYEFFRLNCNCQNSSIRQQINTTTKKAFLRLEAGHAIIMRTDSAENREISASYKSFVAKLMAFCGDWCLFDGANYSRRTTGLTTLLYAAQAWSRLWPTDNSVFTSRLIQRLLQTLSDSYVSNKMLANQILLHCPLTRLREQEVLYSQRKVERMMTSVKPDESVTAAHYLEYCVHSQTHFHNVYDAVLWCESVLDTGLATAQTSLLKAARVNPLYGPLLCLRHLLSLANLANVHDEQQVRQWREFFIRLIPKCEQLTDVVAPIVNSSAPEGHLPNDFSDIETFIVKSEDKSTDPEADDSDEIDVSVTPQCMLICAWRTVREVSLLLGDVTLNTPVQSSLRQSRDGLITIDALLQIGAHFQQLLAETKHRGAFEQAYVGFSKVCVRMWRANEPELHCRPMKWLRELMAIIADDVDDELMANTKLCVEKLCATRRSAGVPFMVQALITSEFQVCSSTGLSLCMKRLIELCRSAKKTESRTHALNILRALFRCTELGDAISEYISDGIECSIRGYGASNWPERNSSTLLFAALMTRIFGVQRTRESDNLNIRNKMTGRIFFIRYPQLYDFFLSELQHSSQAIQRNERPTRLHPLLLLISRLYPSALEGSESNLKLTTFIPLISSCSSSPELVTRNLSAKSLVALIAPGKVPERIFEILETLKNSKGLSANSVNGYLLQILYLLRATKNHTHRISADVLLDVIRQFLSSDLQCNGHSVLIKVYLEILVEIFVTCRLGSIDTELQLQHIVLHQQLAQHFTNAKGYNRLTQSYLLKSFTLFELLLHHILPEGSIDPVTSGFETYEQSETTTNVLLLLLCRKHDIEYEKQDFSPQDIDFVSYLMENDGTDTAKVYAQLPDVNMLYAIADNREVFYPFGTIKAHTALGILINAQADLARQSTLEQILTLMESASTDQEIDDVANATWKYVNSILTSGRVELLTASDSQLAKVLLCLRHISQTYKSSDLRLTAANAIPIIAQAIWKAPYNRGLLIEFSSIVLTLLRDDSIAVRDRISDFVFELTLDPMRKAIPIVAEDTYLRWLDQQFITIDPANAWSLWRNLLCKYDLSQRTEQNGDENVESGGDLEDIFDANEANIFGETLYACYKCYRYLLERIDANENVSDEEKATLRTKVANEFPTLADF